MCGGVEDDCGGGDDDDERDDCNLMMSVATEVMSLMVGVVTVMVSVGNKPGDNSMSVP